MPITGPFPGPRCRKTGSWAREDAAFWHLGAVGGLDLDPGSCGPSRSEMAQEPDPGAIGPQNAPVAFPGVPWQ